MIIYHAQMKKHKEQLELELQDTKKKFVSWEVYEARHTYIYCFTINQAQHSQQLQSELQEMKVNNVRKVLNA